LDHFGVDDPVFDHFFHDGVPVERHDLQRRVELALQNQLDRRTHGEQSVLLGFVQAVAEHPQWFSDSVRLSVFPQDDLAVRISPQDDLLQFNKSHAVDIRLAEVQYFVLRQDVFWGSKFKDIHFAVFQTNVDILSDVIRTDSTYESSKREPDFQFNIVDIKLEQ